MICPKHRAQIDCPSLVRNDFDQLACMFYKTDNRPTPLKSLNNTCTIVRR